MVKALQGERDWTKYRSVVGWAQRHTRCQSQCLKRCSPNFKLLGLLLHFIFWCGVVCSKETVLGVHWHTDPSVHAVFQFSVAPVIKLSGGLNFYISHSHARPIYRKSSAHTCMSNASACSYRSDSFSTQHHSLALSHILSLSVDVFTARTYWFLMYSLFGKPVRFIFWSDPVPSHL